MDPLILDEGRAEGPLEGDPREARRMLERPGKARIGPMTAEVRARIEAVADLDR